MTPVPPLSTEQRRAALLKAHQSRLERARLKQNLKEGKIGLAEVFERATTDPDGVAARSRPLELIKALPGFSNTLKAKALLDSCGVAQQRRIRGLGPRQRQALIERTAPVRIAV